MSEVMPADDWPGAAEFCGEYMAREPALQFAARFTGLDWLLRVVLIEEWMECLFALSHIDLARAKLAWWTDEADLAKAGAPRHPLTLELRKFGADFAPLSTATRAALDWVELSNASDQSAQASQLHAFAKAAAALMEPADSASNGATALWQTLALKRQLQWHGKPDRYGPAWATRTELAQHQLKSNQLGDKQLTAALLRARLIEVSNQLLSLARQKASGERATRIFAILHAAEAKHWANRADLAFFPTRIGPLTLIKAWWQTR